MPSAGLPSRIGRYEVIARLGRGGMGAVFLARDPVINRRVAIKVLLDDLDSGELRERFQREARLAGGLRHQNIVTIFDVGDDSGGLFIAMEYIEGETLAHIIHERRALPLWRRLAWIEELCVGLHYAHCAGVVHRDIKPANIMITTAGTLKILDFGIARLGESGLTQTGMMVGTLNYSAPEQMEGRAVDARADIFSVGAVAYELLAYQRAFPGDLAGEVIHKILNGSVEPLDRVCRAVDPEVVSIVNRCLAKSASDRWPDLDVVRQTLASIRLRSGDEDRQDANIDAVTTEPRDRPPAAATPASRDVRRDSDRQRVLRIRAEQIQKHLQDGRLAFERQEYDLVVDACRQAMVLDPDHAESNDLEARARAALDLEQIKTWVEEARRELDRGSLTGASILVERALTLDGSSIEALALERAIAEARRLFAEGRREPEAAADGRHRRETLRHRVWAAVGVLTLVVSAVAIDLRLRTVPPPGADAGSLEERSRTSASAAPQTRAAAEDRPDASPTRAMRPDENRTPENVGDKKGAPTPRLKTPASTGPSAGPASDNSGRDARTGSLDVAPGPVAVNNSETLQLACDRGDAATCFTLGLSYQKGTGVQNDQVRATGLFQRSCDGGSAQGCNATGVAYSRGFGVPADENRAATLYQRACDGSYAAGCVNLGLMYVRGASVSKDETRASPLFLRGCDLGDGAGCANLGREYELGQGVPKDEARAVALYQRGCATGNAGACTSFGSMYFRGVGIEKDEARAVTLFQRACGDGNAPGCNSLGFAYAQGRGVSKDEKRAADLYQQACDKGGLPACVNLGLMYVRGGAVMRDETRAATLFQRACDGGHSGGCMNLGGAYANGRGVSRDESRAAGLFQRACDSGTADGCTRAATMYEQGRGVPKDGSRAAALYSRGRELLSKSPNAPVPAEAATAVPGNTSRGGAAIPAPTPKDGPSATPPPGVLRVGGLIKSPTKVKDVRPDYPAAALYARVEGVVIIEVTIGADGKVAQTKILRSIPLLDGAAEDAVKQWQYTPTIVDGKPAPVMLTVTVNFTMPGAPTNANTANSSEKH